MQQDQFSVERHVKKFEGWDTLGKLLEKAKRTKYPHHHYEYPEGLISTLFLTGLRIHEVIPGKTFTKRGKTFRYGLRKSHFDFSGDYYIQISNVPILKRWQWTCKKCGQEWRERPKEEIRQEHELTTERMEPEANTRTIRIRKEFWVETDVFVGRTEKERLQRRKEHEEKFSEIYGDFIESLTNYVEDLDGGFLFSDLSYQQAWKLCQKKVGGILDMKTPPHWFRAQRACQLAVEQNASVMDLMEYFQWKDEKTALRYTRVERPPNMESGRQIG